MYKLDLEKAEEPEIKFPTSVGPFPAREFQKNICFIDYTKAFDYVDHNKLWKILKDMRIPDHLTCLLRNLYADQEATVRSFQDGGGWVVDRKAEVKAPTKSNGPRIIPSPTSPSPRSPAGAQQKRECFRFYFLNKQVNQTTCQHGAEIHVIHQKWKIYEPYRPSQKRSSEKRIKEEQKTAHDGTSCSFKDEGSKTNYPGHGKIG